LPIRATCPAHLILLDFIIITFLLFIYKYWCTSQTGCACSTCA
jgi:hypothetical protein